MATIKSYTDLSQSRKLTEILPLESSDMEYMFLKKDGTMVGRVPFIKDGYEESDCMYNLVPCWSLAALLSILPHELVHNKNIVFLEFHVWENSLEYVNNADYTLYVTERYNNPIDACIDMIEKLNKLKML